MGILENQANFIVDELFFKITSGNQPPPFPVVVEVPSNLIDPCKSVLSAREKQFQIPLTEMILFREI